MKQAYTLCELPMIRMLKYNTERIETVISGSDKRCSELTAKYGRTSKEYLEERQRLNGLLLETGVYLGGAVHLYMPGLSFCNWLVNCVSKLSAEYAQPLVSMLGTDVGVAHFPTDSKLHTLLFAVNPADAESPAGISMSFWDSSRKVACMRSERFDGIAVETLRDTIIDVSSSEHKQRGNDSDEWYVRLVAGIGLYVSCFPEAVVNFLPDFLKHPSHHDHKVVKTINISPKIRLSEGGTHASPNAHFRVGHFRYLKSEKFVNKKGQFVWIEETFVNGRYKIVLDPEGVDNAA